MVSPRPASPITVAAILLAGGAGVRLGSQRPKAFHQVGGRTLLEHAQSRFAEHPLVRDVVVVVPAAFTESVQATAGSAVVTPGGVTRLDSVRAGLAVLAPDIDAVLVHDVARPFVPAEVITRVVLALAGGAEAVIPALPVIDTIKSVRGNGTGADEVVEDTLDRSRLRAIQTPQGFRLDVLRAAHADPLEVTDDARLVELAGGTVTVVLGADESFKITRPWDLAVAQAMAATIGAS